MAEVFLSLGFRVDVVNYNDEAPPPAGPYDLVVDLHDRLGDFVRRLGPRPLYVAYATGSHWRFQNEAELSRLEDLHRRRGLSLKARRQVAPMTSLEAADAVLMLGNGATRSTYGDLRVPVHMMNVSSPEAPWPEGKDFRAAARRFLWIGGRGLVHKGLDLVLEAFAGMPELELTVFADTAPEPDFMRTYRNELSLPNIRPAGWVEVRSDAFRAACRECAGLVFPSCSESQSAAVAAGLHHGLIPVLSKESGYDGDSSWNVLLESCTVENLRAALRRLAGTPPETLAALSRAAWEKAQRDHTPAAFEARFRQIVTEELLPLAARKAGRAA
jgi:glycosyltransferase involved in cell wall biosynthesis